MCFERSTVSHDYSAKRCENIILSYAFKMRQDYLSSSYLDQKYLPSERSERGRYELIQVTCAEIILSHFECIWRYFSHTFHYLTDEISWKYEKTCQSGTWMLVPLICVRLTFSPRRFTRITLAMCGALRFQRRWRSWVRLSISHMWGSEVVITYISGWDVFWEVHCITWLFSQKVWEFSVLSVQNACNTIETLQNFESEILKTRW